MTMNLYSPSSRCPSPISTTIMPQDYEMYKIHRQGQQNNDQQKKLTKKLTWSYMNAFFDYFDQNGMPPPKTANGAGGGGGGGTKKVRFEKDLIRKSKSPLDDEDDEKAKVKVATITIDSEEDEKQKIERKKRTQEDMVADFVKILEQMMNPRQAVTSIISAAMGVAAITVALIYFGELPESAVNAKQLVVILAAYGILQIVLATAFFITCMQTTIAVSKGVKDAFQIVIGLLVALVYVAVTLISLAVGVFGFYKTLCIVSFVEYEDTESHFYCPPTVFYTSLIVFILHIVLIVAKCCCCK